MKYLIAGLGNIGAEYEQTRHNIGFKILDHLIQGSGIFFELDRYASVARLKFKGRTFVLIKPTTYMNRSGKAVSYWLQKESISIDQLLVVTDDLALPFGTLRMKGKGSDGGHNGLKDINAVLGRSDYSRLRFGIGNRFSRGQQVDYVLGKWDEEERLLLPERLDMTGEMIKAFGTIGLERTMSEFNNK